MPAKGLSRRKTAAEVLSDKGLVSSEQIRQAEEAARKDRKLFVQSIVDAGAVSKHDLLAALSTEWQVQAVDLTKVEIDLEVARIIPESACRRHGSVPFAKEENLLYVAMPDPKDFFVCEDVALRTGLQVQGVLALPQDISDALDTVYGRSGAAAVSRLIEEVARKDESGQPGGVDILSDQIKTDITEVDASAPEVEKLVNAIILTALSMKASDIHIEPFEDPTGRDSRVLV
ncbi:MAG: hypothetical protein KGI84_07045, partial [Elusimicrobia bacterium]|nr:hypothetical protein [Elusimicrobiota bacterium]